MKSIKYARVIIPITITLIVGIVAAVVYVPHLQHPGQEPDTLIRQKAEAIKLNDVLSIRLQGMGIGTSLQGDPETYQVESRDPKVIESFMYGLSNAWSPPLAATDGCAYIYIVTKSDAQPIQFTMLPAMVERDYGSDLVQAFHQFGAGMAIELHNVLKLHNGQITSIRYDWGEVKDKLKIASIVECLMTTDGRFFDYTASTTRFMPLELHFSNGQSYAFCFVYSETLSMPTPLIPLQQRSNNASSRVHIN